MKHYVLILLSLIVFSCQKDDNGPINYREQNEKDIINYIESHDLDATKSASGLHYVILEQGEGEHPNSNSNVTVKYKGTYLNGTIFDKSNEEGIRFNLQQVIAGWTEGVTYFKEGGEGILLIPSHLAYGSTDLNGIPAGSVLIFDIELIDIE